MAVNNPVGIVGAGLMGTGIAAVFASAGIASTLIDVDPARLAQVGPGLETIARELAQAGVIDASEIEPIVERVRTATSLDALSAVHFVLEAVPERLALKHELYVALESVLADDAIIASNTSGLMPSVLAQAMRVPARLIVAHFWNPPHAIPLVEVVPGRMTSDVTIARTMDLMRAIGQEPVLIRREIPGFIGNRLQYALLREALAIVRSGAAGPQEVDAVMRASLGRRYATTGPIETADLGGLDTFLSIAEQLMPELAKDEEVLELLRARVNDGAVGPRTGRGFYPWPAQRADAVRGRRNRDLLRRRAEDALLQAGEAEIAERCVSDDADSGR
jgi:3-hydroxybutyryl-CoA dehydrogenase